VGEMVQSCPHERRIPDPHAFPRGESLPGRDGGLFRGPPGCLAARGGPALRTGCCSEAFLQNFPKALTAGPSGDVRVALWPREYPSTHELQAGEIKTYETAFYFHTGNQGSTAGKTGWPR